MTHSDEWKELAGLAARICLRHNLIDPDETIIGVGQTGLLEHLIHEICHMVSLDLKDFDPALTSEMISNHLAATVDAGVENETTVWAIEWLVWQALGMPFEWGDLEYAAEIQGCDSTDVAKLVDPESEGSERTYTMSIKVIDEIRSLALAEANEAT